MLPFGFCFGCQRVAWTAKVGHGRPRLAKARPTGGLEAAKVWPRRALRRPKGGQGVAKRDLGRPKGGQMRPRRNLWRPRGGLKRPRGGQGAAKGCQGRSMGGQGGRPKSGQGEARRGQGRPGEARPGQEAKTGLQNRFACGLPLGKCGVFDGLRGDGARKRADPGGVGGLPLS